MHREETVRVSGLVTGYHTRRGEVTVTRSIDASLWSGELTCLLGPNGAGKSTLLKTLTAFLPPLGGEIYVGGRPLGDYSAPELARVIGVVLTERLNPVNMSVDELVGMGRSPYTGFWGHMSATDREVVDRSIDLVGIGRLRGRMVHTLSDGERQKVMIAKALAQETPVIFLDEPTAFLDYPSKVEIMQLLQRLARHEGKTIFLSTHDLELALQIANKVWLIGRGEGVTIGTPEDLALNGEMQRYFNREGVEFDIMSGLFRICHPVRAHVVLTGEGRWMAQARRGLARRGIAAVDDVECEVSVMADGSGIRVNGLGVGTVGEMLEHVERLLENEGKVSGI